MCVSTREVSVACVCTNTSEVGVACVVAPVKSVWPVGQHQWNGRGLRGSTGKVGVAGGAAPVKWAWPLWRPIKEKQVWPFCVAVQVQVLNVSQYQLSRRGLSVCVSTWRRGLCDCQYRRSGCGPMSKRGRVSVSVPVKWVWLVCVYAGTCEVGLASVCFGAPVKAKQLFVWLLYLLFYCFTFVYKFLIILICTSLIQYTAV